MKFDARLDRVELRHEYGLGNSADRIAGKLVLDVGEMTQRQMTRLSSTLGGYLTVVVGAERFTEPVEKKSKAKR